MLQETPIEARLSYATSPSGGRFSRNGFTALTSRFATQESLNEFLRWRENPVTLAYLAAFRALAASMPPAYLNRDSVELQYGVQSGVQMAASLMDDPTILCPSLFSVPTSGPDPDDQDATDYRIAPDAAGG